MMQFLLTIRAIIKSEKAQGRVVCVLVPNKKWFRHLIMAGAKNEPGVCWFRSSANPASLKSIVFDTLVVVQIPRPEGYNLIKEKMRLSTSPRTINVQDHNVRDL